MLTKEQFKKVLENGYTIKGGQHVETHLNMRTKFLSYNGFAYFYYSFYYEHYVVCIPQGGGTLTYSTNDIDQVYEDFVKQYTRTKDIEGVEWKF